MKIIIPTYRDIQWIIPCYLHLHKKYWGEPITWIAERQYVNGENFISYPNLMNGMIYSGHFTDVLIWYLQQIEENFIIIMLSDYLITKPVNTDVIKLMINYMAKHKNILRCQLGNMFGSEKGSNITDTIGDIKICEGNFLPTSLTPGIWNRKLLLEMLEPNWCAWGMEIHGRDKFIDTKWRSICPLPQPLDYINALRGRIPDKMVITPELLNEIGYLIPNNVER